MPDKTAINADLTPPVQTSDAKSALPEYSYLISSSTLQSMTLAQPYCPMVLSYREENFTPQRPRQWTLTFQQKPALSVTLEGDEPTPAEIAETMRWMPWAPLLMVQMIECVIGQLIAQRGKASA